MNQTRTEDYLSRIDREYPVRSSAEQKQAFRAWALGEAERSEEHTSELQSRE